MILGLTGLKESGKDTVGAYLIKEHNFERRSFAEPLKRSIAAFLDIPYSEVDKHKLDDSVFVSVGYKNRPNSPKGEHPLASNIPAHMWSPIRELTFREALQRYGTESHRDIFGDDFWTDQAFPVGGYYNGRAIVVTDVRFVNEAQRIRDIGGKIVLISRSIKAAIRMGVSLQDNHRSETELATIEADYVIDNSSSILDLYERTERMLTELGVVK